MIPSKAPTDLKKAYQDVVKFRWAFVADLFLFVLAVEAIRIWMKPFEGFWRLFSIRTTRIYPYLSCLSWPRWPTFSIVLMVSSHGAQIARHHLALS